MTMTLNEWNADPDRAKFMETFPRATLFNKHERLDDGTYKLENLISQYPGGSICIENYYDDVIIYIAYQFDESDDLYLKRLEDAYSVELKKKEKDRIRQTQKTEKEYKQYLALKHKFEPE